MTTASYEIVRNAREKSLHVIFRAGGFHALPDRIRHLGPWQGLSRGDLDHLKLHYRLLVAEQGFCIVYQHLTSFSAALILARRSHRVRSEGADIRAVTVWSLFGAVDWSCLLTEQRNCYEPGPFDGRGSRPRPTALAVGACGRSRPQAPTIIRCSRSRAGGSGTAALRAPCDRGTPEHPSAAGVSAAARHGGHRDSRPTRLAKSVTTAALPTPCCGAATWISPTSVACVRRCCCTSRGQHGWLRARGGRRAQA